METARLQFIQIPRLAKALVFLLHLGLSVSSKASDSCQNLFEVQGPSLVDVFRAAYQLPEIYKPAQCGLNIKKLLLHFEQSGVELRNPQVIFLLHEKRRVAGGPIMAGQLLPSSNRSFDRAWLFHVILKIEDPITGQTMIMDLDHRSSAVPIVRYFDLMFPSTDRSDRLSLIAAKIIDVPTYLKAFEDFSKIHKNANELQVVGNFRSTNDPQFPIISVRQMIDVFINPAR